MDLEEAQKRVATFNLDRDWMRGDVRDLLMNMVEECGEAWNLIKWLPVERQQELFAKDVAEWEDFLGDQLYLLFKIAAFTGADAKKGFLETMNEYEERFPVAKVKGGHANTRAGGHDGKYSTS